MTTAAAPAGDRGARAEALMRRQIVLMAMTLVVAAAALALLWWLSTQPVTTRYLPVSVEGRVRMQPVREWHGGLALRLLVAELVLCGALAVVVVGHAARVIAFTFQRGR